MVQGRWSEVRYPDTDGTGTYSLSQYTVRIENDDGAWQGTSLAFEGSAADLLASQAVPHLSG